MAQSHRALTIQSRRALTIKSSVLRPSRTEPISTLRPLLCSERGPFGFEVARRVCWHRCPCTPRYSTGAAPYLHDPKGKAVLSAALCLASWFGSFYIEEDLQAPNDD